MKDLLSKNNRTVRVLNVMFKRDARATKAH